jgi:hypothetical protein
MVSAATPKKLPNVLPNGNPTHLNFCYAVIMIHLHAAIMNVLRVTGNWRLVTPVAATIAAAHPRARCCKKTLPFLPPLLPPHFIAAAIQTP